MTEGICYACGHGMDAHVKTDKGRRCQHVEEDSHYGKVQCRCFLPDKKWNRPLNQRKLLEVTK